MVEPVMFDGGAASTVPKTLMRLPTGWIHCLRTSAGRQ